MSETGGGQVALQVDGAGDSEVTYDFNWSGAPASLTVNPDFLIQSLAIMRGDDVVLEIGSEMTPTILRESNDADPLESFCVYAVVRQ